jgi:hypothetical protein
MALDLRWQWDLIKCNRQVAIARFLVLTRNMEVIKPLWVLGQGKIAIRHTVEFIKPFGVLKQQGKVSIRLLWVIVQRKEAIKLLVVMKRMDSVNPNSKFVQYLQRG